MAIRIALASDLHLEFGSSLPCDLSGLAATADILLAPGDISNGNDAIDWCAGSPIPVVFVPGNHEYYRCDLGKTRVQMAEYVRRFPHVHMLDPGIAEFEIRGQRVRVIGATLWTDYQLYGPKLRDLSMEAAASGLNDHCIIAFQGGRWHPIDALTAFAAERKFIAQALSEPYDGLTVVVTHHAPSGKLVHPQFHKDVLSAAFASNLDKLVAKADVWAYGHTHSNIELEIGKCRVISNQRGYRNENFGWKLRVYEFEVPPLAASSIAGAT